MGHPPSLTLALRAVLRCLGFLGFARGGPGLTHQAREGGVHDVGAQVPQTFLHVVHHPFDVPVIGHGIHDPMVKPSHYIAVGAHGFRQRDEDATFRVVSRNPTRGAVSVFFSATGHLLSGGARLANEIGQVLEHEVVGDADQLVFHAAGQPTVVAGVGEEVHDPMGKTTEGLGFLSM